MLADLAEADLADYARHLTIVVPSRRTRVGHRASVRLFWRYRHCLATDRLTFDPLQVEGWCEAQAQMSAENATDRIPEHVHGPLLAWALRFIDDFSADILAADKHWHAARQAARQKPVRQGQRDHNPAGKLATLLDKHQAEGRPLPGYRGKLNLQALATQVGCSRAALDRRRAAIDAVAAVVGVHHDTPYAIPVDGLIDGEPWINCIVADSMRPNGLGMLARMLQAAVYVAVGFLSGMRDSEIKHLRRGCLRTERGPDGTPYRFKVTSKAFKGEADSAGVTATWVIGAPAARAIHILEQLQAEGTEVLFANLPHSGGSGPSRHAPSRTLGNTATNSQLNDFTAWINEYCAINGRADTIPKVNGQSWRLSTRQFRRSLAWFIARRPGGAIAGAIAYRHLSIQMFEGYSGTSDSGFRAEVESEQALARGEQLLAMVDQHEHESLAGPAAAEAHRRLEEFRDQATFAGKVITDEQRLKRLMRREDPAIYPGKYVTCVHNHATAICRQRSDSQGKTRPDAGSCRPFACRNVALTTGNTDQLRHEAEVLQQELDARPLLPPLLQQELRDRVEQIHAFLAQHTKQAT